jgi:hypothetical protein
MMLRLAIPDSPATALAVSAHAWTLPTDVVLAIPGPDTLAAGTLAASLDATPLVTPGDRLAAGSPTDCSASAPSGCTSCAASAL